MGMRWCGGMLIMIGSVCVGIWLRTQYLYRLQTTKDIQCGISLLKGEIQYGRVPLPEACLSVALRLHGNSRLFFQTVSERLQERGGTVEKVWRESIENVFGRRLLGAGDYEEFIRLGNTLGNLDVELQVRAMELCMKRLEESISCYEKEKNNQTKLYPVVGTFGGFLLCLVLL